MSLLTKASTVTTPTAYSEGLLHSVKPVVNLGSELVTNGDFSDGSTGWTAGTGWSISGGQATHSGSTGNLVTNASLSTNNRYLVTFEIISIDNGVCNIYDTSTATTYASFSTAGIKSTIITKDSSADLAFRSSSSDAVIDNVSIKEVIGADFDFARASAATRVNEQGLIEKERGNLLLQSNSFDTTWLNQLGGSVTGGQTGYDGTNDAWLLNKSATSYRYIRQFSLSASGVYNYSIYAKANTLDQITIFNDASGTNPYAKFSLVDGSVVASSGLIDSSATDVGSGWWRLSATFNDTITTARIYIDFAETTAGSIYIQDAQLEQGLVATDYIETTTTAVYEGITDNIPRINYEGGNGNFLLEPQRTNIYDNSEYFDDWNSNRLDRTANNLDSPEGVQNAYKVAQQSGFTTAPNINKGGIAAGTYTISIFAKKGSWNYLAISFQGVSYFNLETGSKGTINSNHTATIEDYGNGWYRCAITRTTTTTQTPAFYFAESDNTLTTSDTQGYMYAYGAQLEAGSYPTSYIPTYGTSVTFASETCNNAGNSDLFNDSEGVLYAEIAALVDDLTQRHISISDGSQTDVVRIHYHTTSNSIRGQVRAGGSITASLTHIVPDITDFHKVAISYKENDVKLYINGVEVATDTNATMPTGLDELSFDRGDGSLDFYGKNKMVATFTEALSDSELECLTSWSSFNRMATAQNYTIE